MRVTQRVKKLISSYENDNPGTKAALARILMEGKLAGTGRAVILPIDHAFSKTMVPKFSGSEPDYHFQLALDAELNAIAAPLAMIEVAGDSFSGALPLILQMQVGDPFGKGENGFEMRGSVRDALRLGCVGISCTLTDYEQSGQGNTNDVAELIGEAKSFGLAVMSWVSTLTPDGDSDTSAEAIARGANRAAEIGAHLICVRVPGSHVGAAPSVTAPLSDRIRQVSRACNRRVTVFASNVITDDAELFEEIRGMRDGGAQGCVLPPNSLYRPYDEALSILDKSINIYQGKL